MELPPEVQKLLDTALKIVQEHPTGELNQAIRRLLSMPLTPSPTGLKPGNATLKK